MAQSWRLPLLAGLCFGLGYTVVQRLMVMELPRGDQLVESFRMREFPGTTLESLRLKLGEAARPVRGDLGGLERAEQQRKAEAERRKRDQELEAERQRERLGSPQPRAGAHSCPRPAAPAPGSKPAPAPDPRPHHTPRVRTAATAGARPAANRRRRRPLRPPPEGSICHSSPSCGRPQRPPPRP